MAKGCEKRICQGAGGRIEKKAEKQIERVKKDAAKKIEEIKDAAESNVADAKRSTRKLQDRVDDLESRYRDLLTRYRNRRSSISLTDTNVDVDVDEEYLKTFSKSKSTSASASAVDADTAADLAIRLEIEEKERLLAAGVKIEDDLSRYKPILATTKILTRIGSTESDSSTDTDAVKRLYFIVTGIGAAISEEENEGSGAVAETIEGFILGSKPPPKLDSEKFGCYWAGQLLNHEKLPEARRFSSIQDCKEKCALLYPGINLSGINSLKDFFIIIDNHNHCGVRRQPVSIDWLLTKDVPQSKIGLSRTCMHLSEQQTQVCKDKSYLSRYSSYFEDSFFLSYF